MATDRFVLPFALLLAQPAQAEELPVIGQSAVTTPSRSEEQRDLGLEMLWLPVESRDSLADYAGRNLPGATFGADGGLRLRGGRTQDTAFEVDGMRVRRLSLPLAMVDRFTLASAGYGPEWGDVMGGVLSAATKSGDNRLRVDVDSFAERREALSGQAGSTTVSLPILKDRLFLLMSVRAETWKEEAEPDPEGILADPPDLTGLSLDGGLKLTWIPAPGHRVESLTLLDSSRQDHTHGLGIEEDAQPTYDQTQWTASLRWMGRLSERIGAHAQVGFQHLRGEEAPLRCRTDPATCDTIPRQIQKFPRWIRAGNWSHHQIERDTGWQVRAGLDALVKDGPLARERLRLSSRLRTDRDAWDYRVPGDRLLEFNQGPEAETVYFANDARTAPGQFGWSSNLGSWWSTTHALESETRLLDRLWIVPGVGLAVSGASAESFSERTSAITPHLGLAWNAFGDGRTWLRASFHERADADLDDLARFGRAYVVYRKCNWNPDTMAFDRSCIFSGGPQQKTVGLPCGPDNVARDGTPCAAGLELARSREYALGASHELGPGVRTSLDVVYRRATGLPQVEETNRIWNSSGTSTSGYRNGRAESVSDYTAALDQPDRYLGVTGSLARQDGAFKFMLAYTWAHHETTLSAGNGWGTAGPASVTGDAEDDRRHGLRALASYDAGGFASFGAAYSFDTGVPFNRLFRPVGALEGYRAGANPGTNVSDPADDRPSRYPDQQRLNLQARVRAQRLLHVDLDLYVDFIDVLSTPKRVVLLDSTFTYTPYVVGGRWVRAGLQYRY